MQSVHMLIRAVLLLLTKKTSRTWCSQRTVSSTHAQRVGLQARMPTSLGMLPTLLLTSLVVVTAMLVCGRSIVSSLTEWISISLGQRVVRRMLSHFHSGLFQTRNLPCRTCRWLCATTMRVLLWRWKALSEAVSGKCLISLLPLHSRSTGRSISRSVL